MVGALLVVLARLLRRGLFRQVEVVGLDRIPDDRSVLLVASHFNGFVDVALTVAALARLPRFVGKATIAINPLVRWALRVAGVVLVQRPEDVPGADNTAMFREVTDALLHGRMVAVFPEGTTHDRTSLARIRTGAARMAFGAAGAGADVVIVPVGITYYDKVALRTSALVQVGAPIDVAAFAADGHAPPTVDDHEAVRECTELIQERLRAITPDFDDPADYLAADLAAEVSLRTAARPDPPLLERAQRVAVLGKVAPSDRSRLTDVLGRYHLALAASHLDDEHVVTGAPLRNVARPLVIALLAVTVLAPLTLLGLALNALPALIVAAVSLFVATPVTKGTVRMLTAVVVFPITWIVAAVLVSDDFAAQVGLVIAAPVCGLIALGGAAAVLHAIQSALDWRMATERRAAVAELRERRAEVVDVVNHLLPISGPGQDLD